MTMPANLATASRAATGSTTAVSPVAIPPTAVAVDLGSCTIGVWASYRGAVSGPCGDAFETAGTLVRRGRVVDPEGCVTLLSQLTRQYADPVPSGGVVVACRPVLTDEPEQDAMRRVLENVFAPARLLFIDTVRAAAIGSGAAAGTLLIADIGAQLTEVAVLQDGRPAAARRADIGTRDLTRGVAVQRLSDIVARHIQDIRGDPAAPDLRPAVARGLLLVGDGALNPDLTLRLSRALRLRVHCAACPRTAALTGAGLAAMSAVRHPG
jgi:rod shape-determining protein MreB and related proteins